MGPGCDVGRVSLLVEVEFFDWQRPSALNALSLSEFGCVEDSGGDAGDLGSPLARLELSGLFVVVVAVSEGFPCCDNTD